MKMFSVLDIPFLDIEAIGADHALVLHHPAPPLEDDDDDDDDRKPGSGGGNIDPDDEDVDDEDDEDEDETLWTRTLARSAARPRPLLSRETAETLMKIPGCRR